MENSLSRSTKSFPQMLNSILRGLVSGLVGGVIAGAIGSLIYWVPTKYSYYQLYANLAIRDVIWGDILLVGIPLGLTIGIDTGLHAAIFRKDVPRLFLWISLNVIGVVLAVWLSGRSVNVNNPVFFFLKLVFISLATSWLTHQFVMQEYRAETSKKLLSTVICLISGSLFTFLIVYGYFRFWVYLQNIPS